MATSMPGIGLPTEPSLQFLTVLSESTEAVSVSP